MSQNKPSIVVLISGNGSNLQAMIDGCDSGSIAGTITAVVSDQSDAYGLERAKQADITTHHLAYKGFDSREAYDQALIKLIDQHQPDLLILAGFMRILSPCFIQHFAGKMLNVHPSLLPKYQGLHTHQRAIDAGDTEHGTSVHFVTEELDGGPVILQAKVPIFTNDSADEVQARVQEQEHRIYPLVANWFVTGRLAMKGSTAELDGVTLPASGYATE